MALEAATIAAIGTAVSVAGAGVGAYSTYQASAASRRAEQLRQKQLRIDASNRRRESIRKQILANSISTSRSVAQGIGEGSSVLFGAVGQAAGQAGRDISYVNASEDISAGIFSANADQARFQGYAALGNQAGLFGNALMTQSTPLSQIGATLFGSAPAASPPPAASWVPTVQPATAAPMTIPTGPQYPWYSNTGGD